MTDMFRRRVGTGALYSNNRLRLPQSGFRRLPRRRASMRGSNSPRPWQMTDEPPLDLANVDFAQVASAARGHAQGQVLLDLLRDVGEFLQKCRRARARLHPAVAADMGDMLRWFLVLFTIGAVDSKGRWLEVKGKSKR